MSTVLAVEEQTWGLGLVSLETIIYIKFKNGLEWMNGSYGLESNALDFVAGS